MATTFAPVYDMIFSFRDAKGQTARTRLYGTTAGAFADQATLTGNLLAALQGLSNAVIYAYSAPNGNVGAFVQYGTAATYENVEDKAVFSFQDGQGRMMRYEVPAPKSAIFLSDAETINPANALALAFINAVLTPVTLATVTNKDGQGVQNYVGGVRRRRKYQRRGNIFILTPQLTPEIPEE